MLRGGSLGQTGRCICTCVVEMNDLSLRGPTVLYIDSDERFYPVKPLSARRARIHIE
jgi:hypothetical protein